MATPRAIRGGFSLLEAMVALGLLAVAVLGLLAALHNSQQLDSLSRERTQASAKCMSVLEDVLAEDWASLPGRSGETFDVEVESENGVTLLLPEEGAPRVGSVQVSATAHDRLLKVEVKARWRSSGGKAVEVVLRSLVSEH